MHIAICVWGIVRSLRFTIESIHNYCLDPITKAGHTYEIYMHTYKFHGVYDNARSNERGLRLNFSEWRMLQPDHIYVEDQDLFDQSQDFSTFHGLGDPWKNDFVSFQNHLRAMNSLYYLASQVEKDSQHKHFDGIVYLRPDVTYLNELPFHLLEHLPNTLFVPDFHRSCRGGEYNDRMAMGDLKTGLIYGKKYQAALSYSKRKPLHSEKFVYDYLRTQNVTVKEIPFRFRRTRANGDFHVRDSTAIVAPRNQKPHPTYRTFFALRWVYNVLEELTNHQVYFWNHDDDENLYCKPHPFLSIEEVLHYRKLSRRKRYEKEKQQQRLRIRSDPSVLAEEDDEKHSMGEIEEEKEASTGKARQWGDFLRFGAAHTVPLPLSAPDTATPESSVTGNESSPSSANADTNVDAAAESTTHSNNIMAAVNNTSTSAIDRISEIYRNFYHNPRSQGSSDKEEEKDKRIKETKPKRLNKQESRRRKKNPAPLASSPYETISEFFHLGGGSETVGNGQVSSRDKRDTSVERLDHSESADVNARQSPYYKASKAQVSRAARNTHKRNAKTVTRASNTDTGAGAGGEGRELPLVGFNLRGMASRELESREARKKKARTSKQ